MTCENPEYCEACGDCLNCYGEDPCMMSSDGKHTYPKRRQDMAKMIYEIDIIGVEGFAKLLDALNESFDVLPEAVKEALRGLANEDNKHRVVGEVRAKGFCKGCKNFKNIEKHKDGFEIGMCDIEPFDTREMTSSDMAITYGPDGPIYVGKDFGCVKWTPKPKSGEGV